MTGEAIEVDLGVDKVVVDLEKGVVTGKAENKVEVVLTVVDSW